MRIPKALLAAPVLAFLLAACASHPAPTPASAPAAAAPAKTAADFAPGLDTLAGVLWMQTAAEREAGALQAYTAAQLALDAALADPTWTAAREQSGDFARLPPAIVLDVDETVLDNMPYQTKVIRENRRYDKESWKAWCDAAKAEPIPGAVAFTQYAASRGVTVFYVTNRLAEVTKATRKNLRDAGFPLATGLPPAIGDVLLTRGLKPEWDQSEKSVRRQAIAHDFRILMLVGDDLGDFVDAKLSLEKRRELVTANAGWWGRRWIVISNPVYGSWWDALVDFKRDLSEADGLSRRLKALVD